MEITLQQLHNSVGLTPVGGKALEIPLSRDWGDFPEGS